MGQQNGPWFDGNDSFFGTVIKRGRNVDKIGLPVGLRNGRGWPGMQTGNAGSAGCFDTPVRVQ